MAFHFDLKKFFATSLQRLREIRDAPHAVAGGVAVGMFWGFTPLTGVKTLLSLGTAWVMRCSRISAVIAVSLHDIFLPVWPVILRWEYQLGYWVLSHPHQMPPAFHPHKLKLDHLMSLQTAEVVWRMFVGSIIIGVPLAALTYWITLKMLLRYERRHHTHLQPPP